KSEELDRRKSMMRLFLRRQGTDESGSLSQLPPIIDSPIYLQTIRGTDFMRCSIECDDKSVIVMYMSEIGRSLLESSSAVILDGTFKSRPRNYPQLYSIGVTLDSSFVPCCWAFLTSKRQSTYEEMFDQLDKHVSLKSDVEFALDFEQAVISAVHVKYPDARITLCSVHFARSIQRYLEKNM
ncbi:hypothetical protein PFISCL1PPCAC_23341, partial [Pristionchus fissidentatus]